MESNYQKIIDLVNSSLKKEIFKETINAFDCKVIRANQLSGLVFKALNKDLVEEDAFKLLKNDYYQYLSRDETQKVLIDELRDLFNVNSIDFVFLKGSFIKTIYPESYMRAMGDIDILVRKDKMKGIHLLFDKSGFTNWTNSTSHDCFMKNNINVEIHPMLDSEIEGEYQDLFLEPWKYTVKKLENEYLLLPEYNFYYQLYHLIKHLYRSGVGYRTLVDLMLFLEKYGESFNEEIFFAIYEIFPKKDFVRNIIEIINLLFEKKVLKSYELSGNISLKYLREFINYIFISGTHGYGEDHNLFIGDIAKKHREKDWIVWTKIKFVFSKTFLSLNEMKGLYKCLNKCPWLLPLAWISRMFKLIFKKSSRRKLKRLQVSKDEIARVEDLFNNVGI